MRIKIKDEEKKDTKFTIEKKSSYTKKELDTMYSIVREYIYEHQGSTAIEVSLRTGVPREIIMMFLRQGKISLTEDTKHLLHECSECGALIEAGDICPECRIKKMQNILYPKDNRPQKAMSGFSMKKPDGKETHYGRRIREK